MASKHAEAKPKYTAAKSMAKAAPKAEPKVVITTETIDLDSPEYVLNDTGGSSSDDPPTLLPEAVCTEILGGDRDFPNVQVVDVSCLATTCKKWRMKSSSTGRMHPFCEKRSKVVCAIYGPIQ